MKLLILFPHDLFHTKMSFGRRHVVARLLLEVSGAELSGPGWPGYRDDRPLRENIARIMPRADAILWYKPDRLVEPHDRGGIPAVVAYNEAWWPGRRALREVEASGADLVVCHHANDVRRFDGRRVVHIPHCADPEFFRRFARPWEQRAFDVILTGAVNADVYPLRTGVYRRLDRLREAGLRVKVRPHPGYRLSWEENVNQAEDYAADLGNARVSIVCGSRHRYLLAKYVESMAAGCLLAGDLPDDDEFRRRMEAWMFGESDPVALTKRIIAGLRKVPEVCGLVANRSTLIQREHYSTDGYCRRLLEEMERLIADRRTA